MLYCLLFTVYFLAPVKPPKLPMILSKPPNFSKSNLPIKLSAVFKNGSIVFILDINAFCCSNKAPVCFVKPSIPSLPTVLSN